MDDTRVERRLSAILSVDVAGYSRLMGADEEGTLARLMAHQRELVDPKIAEHRGRIVKTTGDGLLAEFASVVDAVRCAVEVQRGMAERNVAVPEQERIVFRAGVNLGDVIIERGDIFGDGVNIAARLQAMAEPGGLCLSNAVMEQVRDRLPYVFDDLGEHALKNIARPVRVYRVPCESDAAPAGSGIAAFVARPAVAVLPFTNMSGDAGEDYFVDGLTEDIVTTLSYWRWFPVIARNSTAVYKRKPKSVPEIGRELGVAYLIQGGARRDGDRVRITAQLIEANSGQQLWAERFERGMDSVFAVQEEIAERVVVSIEPEIHRAEKQRVLRTRPENLTAWDIGLKALSLLERMNRGSHAEASALLEKSLALDPRSAYAWSMLALCRYHEGILGWAPEREAALKASLSAAQLAVENDDRDWLGQALQGMGMLWTERDFDMALEGQERAVALNPSAPLARHFLACVFEFSQRPAEAIPQIESLLRLDPQYRFASLAHADISLCQFLLGDSEAARASAAKAVRLQPGNVRARQRLVAALSELGRVEDARAAAAELMRMQPDFALDYIDTTYPFRVDGDRQRFVDALQRVGLLSH